jgi:hypothetical protein
MEPNFQTSFIPKKPMIEERAVAPRPIGFLTVTSLFILIALLVAAGGLYFYKGMVSSNITKMKESLKAAESRYEPAKIIELQVLDKRLRASNEILAAHASITPIFELLQKVTMKTVRYTKFSYSTSSSGDQKVLISLSGTAVGYKSIALQSDIFTENKQMIDPLFSNLVLDDKGNVMFDLEFSVDPSFIDYKQNILTDSEAEVD